MLIAAFIVTLVGLVCLFLHATRQMAVWIAVLFFGIALLLITSPVRAQQAIYPKGLECTTTAATTSGTSSVILAANPFRKKLTIQNNSASQFLYVNFGAAATTAHYNIRTNGAVYTQEFGASIQAIHGISGGANNEVVVISCE